MTTTLSKTQVEAKWTISQIQEHATRAMVANCMAANMVLEKLGPQAVEEYQQATLNNRIEYFKTLNVKTPLELIKAMAEWETNVFGSKIVISGDDTKASLEYIECGCWNAMQKCGKLTPAIEEKMGKNFQKSVEMIAKAFGFKGELKLDGQTAIITFNK